MRLQGLTPRICKRGVVVALLVGTALNCINQGDTFLTGGPINIWKVALTYIVPFLVSVHGALTSQTRQRQQD